jgi:hypothetical protein
MTRSSGCSTSSQRASSPEVADDPAAELFSRARILEGSPARRAAKLLFLIEARTAQLVATSRTAMERFPDADRDGDRRLDFLEAFAVGREPPLHPTIQDLERHAPAWAELVAGTDRVRAALAHRLGEKYRFARADVPRLRAALGLDDPDLAAAHAQLYGVPLEAIYSAPRSPRERWRWARAALADRVDGLSPFWTAYALTLTETVGAAILALPIAIALIGPLPGVAVLAALGLLNVLTVSFMADALTRTRLMRGRGAYVGSVVGDLLGRPGAIVLSAGVVGICVLFLQAYYIGISVTLQDATGAPAVAWVTALFAIQLLYLRRGSIDATVASALVVGAVNLLLIAALSGLALAHADGGRLTHVADGLDKSSLQLVFGVIFTAYFGHLSVGNCARVVLAREPSGRDLLRGVAAAQLTAVVVYVLFAVAIAGAVAPATLAAAQGTALAPLADIAGPAVLVLGGVVVVLGMGMASIHSALALFYLVRERLPSAHRRTLPLPCRRARIVLEHRRAAYELTYRGLDRGAARLRIERIAGDAATRVEQRVDGSWETADGHLLVTVVAVEPDEVRLELSTTLRIRFEGAWDAGGLDLGNVLALDGRAGAAVAWILRRGGATTDEVAEQFGGDDVEGLLRDLARRGMLTADGERWVVRPGRRRGGRLSPGLWQTLGPAEPPATPVLTERAPWLARSERRRWLAGVSPAAAMFCVALAQAVTGAASLADVLSFMGVIVVALVAGVFPPLLVLAARRRGELPGTRLPASRPLLALAYGFSIGGVALHGLVLWEHPLQRAAALVIVVLAIVLTVGMVRRGTFAPRATIAVGVRPRGAIDVSVVAAGTSVPASVEVTGRRVTVTPAWDGWTQSEVQVWAHRDSGDGGSEPAAGRVNAGVAEPAALDADGRTTVPRAQAIVVELSGD